MAKVYDDEQTDRDRPAHKIAADDQEGAAQRDETRDLDKIRGLEEQAKLPSASQDERDANIKKKETAVGSAGKGQDDRDNLLKKAGKTFQQMSNRKKAAFGLGGGGLVGLLIFASLISSTYRVPSLLGGLDDNVNSSRIVRLIVERRFERMLVEWQIRKQSGTIRDFVKENSFMDRLYKSFDAVGLEKRLEKENGIRFRQQPDGTVHVFLRDREGNFQGVGTADNWDQYKALKNGKTKTNKDLAKESKRMVTRTIPIARFSMSSTIRRWILKRVAIRMNVPKWDKEKTHEENIEALRKWQIENTTKGTLALFRGALMCMLENKCDQFKDDNQPVDTKTADPREFGPSADPEDRNAKTVADEVDKAGSAATETAAKEGGSWTGELIKELTKTFAKILTSKVTVDLIPIVGQINLMAELDHIGYVIHNNKLALRIPAMLKEQAYTAITAIWKSFADNAKLGKLDINQVNYINAAVIGAGGAVAYNYAFKGTSNKGEGIDPRVDSNVDSPAWAAEDFIYNKSPRRIGHEMLNIWYQIITRPLNAIEDWGFGLIASFLNLIGLNALFTNIMEAAFGDNWKEDLAKWAANAVLELFGIMIDPLAVGAKLFNYLYVGTDVLMNKYCQTNLGCMVLSDPVKSGFFDSPFSLQKTLDADRALYMSTLSTKDRLFSLDEPSSLVNTIIREMPAPLSPGSTVASVVSQISMLPARLLGIASGRAFAAETPNQDAALDGVQQLGVTPAQVDEPIAKEVETEADPQCPKNQDDRWNKCQADKEVGEIASCFSTDCPEFVDTTTTAVDAPANTSGPVSTTGDIRALAKQLLDLRASGQVTMNPEVVQDLTNTMNGNPIGSCGVQNLDPALLNLLVRITQKYKITIWNIVTGHGCNFAPHHFHPKGQATDIGAVNGEQANLEAPFKPLMDATLARNFALYVAGSMPTGRGGMGQSDCSVLVPVNNWPPGVEMFTGDGCNHFHVDVGDYSS
ncbi:MAG TPA: hypothetical protein VLE73_04990 [Candidatus Saccharimonadales bacterium]|nr:hypothetical protein [Candidatus Saccharimonadales bacterium]